MARASGSETTGAAPKAVQATSRPPRRALGTRQGPPGFDGSAPQRAVIRAVTIRRSPAASVAATARDTGRSAQPWGSTWSRACTVTGVPGERSTDAGRDRCHKGWLVHPERRIGPWSSPVGVRVIGMSTRWRTASHAATVGSFTGRDRCTGRGCDAFGAGPWAKRRNTW